MHSERGLGLPLMDFCGLHFPQGKNNKSLLPFPETIPFICTIQHPTAELHKSWKNLHHPLVQGSPSGLQWHSASAQTTQRCRLVRCQIMSKRPWQEQYEKKTSSWGQNKKQETNNAILLADVTACTYVLLKWQVREATV